MAANCAILLFGLILQNENYNIKANEDEHQKQILKLISGLNIEINPLFEI